MHLNESHRTNLGLSSSSSCSNMWETFSSENDPMPCVTWLIHIHTTHSYVYNSFTYVPTHSCVTRHDTSHLDDPMPCAAWLLYVTYDSLKCDITRPGNCDVTSPDSFKIWHVKMMPIKMWYHLSRHSNIGYYCVVLLWYYLSRLNNLIVNVILFVQENVTFLVPTDWVCDI